MCALTTAFSLAACSVPLNPGPGTETSGGASHQDSGTPQIGEAREPVVVGAAKDGTGAGPADGTVVVQPAPKPSSDTNDAGSTNDSDGSAGDGDAAGGSSGGGDTGSSGNAGSGSDDGAPADLSDPVQYAGVLEDEVNARRQAGGLAALTHDDCAYQVALERAEALRGQGLEHAPLGPIFDRCPTSTVGENLARGGWSPAEAADGWMNSEGHRANILNASFTRGAIACIAEDTQYGIQMTCAHVFLG